MAIAHRASSAVVTQTAADPSVAMPTGTTTDDIMVCVAYFKDNVVSTMPAGWTLKTNVNNGSINRLEVWWKRAGVGETGPYTITHSGTLAKKAFISSFSGCIASGDPFNAFSAAKANSSSLTITADPLTPLKADSMILFPCGYGGTWLSIGLGSGTNPTFAQAAALSDATGTGSAIAMDYGLKTDFSATGSRTKTAAGSAQLNCGALLALTNNKATSAIPSQVEGEAVVRPDAAKARSSQVYAEALVSSTSGSARASQDVMEVLVGYTGVPGAGVSQVFMEAVIQNNAPRPRTQIVSAG